MTQSLGAPSSCRSLARRQKAATRTWRPTPLKGPSSHTTALHAPRTTLPAAAQESAKGVVLSAGAQPPERDGQAHLRRDGQDVVSRRWWQRASLPLGSPRRAPLFHGGSQGWACRGNGVRCRPPKLGSPSPPPLLLLHCPGAAAAGAAIRQGLGDPEEREA